jgi:rod shape-determining protein MreC
MKRFNIIALAVFLAVTSLMFFFRPDYVEAIQRGAMSVFGPLIRGKAAIQADPGPDGPKLSPKEMAEKLDRLENELVMLRLRNQELADLHEENASLRRALNYVEKSPLELVPAGVLNREPRSWYNTMQIDKGTSDGISRDSPVIIPIGNDAGLVGKIILAGAETSIVLLLTDEKCQVAASVVGSSHKGIIVGEQGTVIGQRGAINAMPFLNLRYLSKDAKLKPGDTVYSSGVGGVFPPNLLLGTMEELQPGPINMSAKIRPAVDFSVLENVFVVQGVRG